MLRRFGFAVALAAGLSFSAVACSTADAEQSSSSAIDGNQAAGGAIGVLCTESTGNPLGSFIVDQFGGGLPDSDKASSALCGEATSHATAECRDFCEARNPTGGTATIADMLSYASFNTYIPAETWAKISTYLSGSQVTNTEAGVVQCASLVGWAAAEYYYAKRGCDRGSQCMTCDATSTSVRDGCLIGQTVLWCAQALGFQPPPAVSQISAACTVGRLCSKGVLLEGCRRSCAASLAAAAPIARPVETAQGTQRKCCMCDRSTWEDKPLYRGGDSKMSSEYYYSPVSDYDGPVAECEGKDRTTTGDAVAKGPNGYPTYYYYEHCRKVTFSGGVCPADHDYHAPIEGGGQMIKSRYDANQCLTHNGEGNDLSVTPCNAANMAQRWSVHTEAESSSERTVVLRPQTNLNLCVDMHPSEKVSGNGYRAYLYGCHGGANQKFVVKDGKLMQRYTLNNYCIDWWFDLGSTVHMPTCHDSSGLGTGTLGANQQWDIVNP